MKSIEKVKIFIVSLLNLKSWHDVLLNTFFTCIGFLLSYAHLFILDNQEIFIAITAVVIGDFIFGTLANIKHFETQKALKVVWYFVSYNLLAWIVLTIEKGFPAAFWLSETVLLPILVFQVISIAKNLRKLNLITNTTLVDILDKIDKHKDATE